MSLLKTLIGAVAEKEAFGELFTVKTTLEESLQTPSSYLYQIVLLPTPANEGLKTPFETPGPERIPPEGLKPLIV